MWTSTLELTPGRVIPTKILGSFWRGAYFSSFAPFQVQNLPRQPLPSSKWVRVRNSLAGICGSDLHLIFVDGDSTIAPAALPSHKRVYPGHEVVGEVIEVGDEVRFLHAGERVVLQHGPNCVTADIHPLCRSCAEGSYGLCEYGAVSELQPIGGGWSEEMLLHEQQLFRVPDELSNAQAVLLEPSSVAVHAVLRHLPQPGDRVLIIGAGTIGLLILQVIRALTPEAEVHVLARHTFQVERATRLGAAQIIYPRNSYEEIQLATGAQLYRGVLGNKMLLGGYDVIFDTAGSKHTTHDSLRWARAGATVVMVGLNRHRMQLDLTPIWYQEISLIGSMGSGTETWPPGTTARKPTFEITAEMIEHGQIHPEKLITHSYPLSDYRSALLVATGKANNHAIKVVFDYSKQPPSVVPNVRATSRKRPRALISDLESRLSQPLNPKNAGEYQVTPEKHETPVPSAYVQSFSNTTADEEDAKTVLVSPSRYPRFGRTTQRIQETAATNVPNGENEVEDVKQQGNLSSKQASFNVTSHYGNLPGFHQGLDKLGIIEDADEEDETTKTFVVTPPPMQTSVAPSIDKPASDTSVEAELAERKSLAENEDIPLSYEEPTDQQAFEEQPFLNAAPTYTAETEDGYAWTQFITSSNTSENISDAEPLISAAEQEQVEIAPTVARLTDEAMSTVSFTPSAYTDASHEYSWTRFMDSASPDDESKEIQAIGQEGEEDQMIAPKSHLE